MSYLVEEKDRLVRTTGRGTDYYGPCEKCGKSVSETFFAVNRIQITRPDGTTFIVEKGGGIYGHLTCVQN